MHDDSGPSTTAIALATGDYSRLTNEQRAALYLETVARVGLPPICRPFEWLAYLDDDDDSGD